MTITPQEWFEPRPMTEEQRQAALEDLAVIARGEEAESGNLPWGRLRILLDHELVEILCPVVTFGSIRALNITSEGLHWLGLDGLPVGEAIQ